MQLYLNVYSIWWCPTNVASHVRLQLGHRGAEMVHTAAKQSPTLLQWHDHRDPTQTICVGATDLANVEVALRRVNPQFGYYNALCRNCTAYVYCLLSELIGEDTRVLAMLTQTNQAFTGYFGTDFIDINLNLGCRDALRLANDAHRACHVILRFSPPQPKAVIAVLEAQYARCSCRLRRDPILRQACIRMLHVVDPASHYRFLWIGLVRAMATAEILYEFIEIRCQGW